ncbi:hypothetical protein GCM10008941_28580 [Rhizomicrobium palustre]
MQIGLYRNAEAGRYVRNAPFPDVRATPNELPANPFWDIRLVQNSRIMHHAEKAYAAGLSRIA